MTMSIPHHSDFNHFEVINFFTREVNIKAPGLYQDNERAKILELILRKQDAVVSVQTVSDLASVAIQFDPAKLPLKNLLVLLETILTNIGSKVGNTIQHIKPYTRAIAANEENVFTLVVAGMSCGCCAFSLEMGLKRESGISAVAVDFASAAVKISGTLSPQEAIDRIIKLGYSASLNKPHAPGNLFKQPRDSLKISMS